MAPCHCPPAIRDLQTEMLKAQRVRTPPPDICVRVQRRNREFAVSKKKGKMFASMLFSQYLMRGLRSSILAAFHPKLLLSVLRALTANG